MGSWGPLQSPWNTPERWAQDSHRALQRAKVPESRGYEGSTPTITQPFRKQAGFTEGLPCTLAGLALFYFIFFLGPRRAACRISVPQPGTEPGPSAMEVRSPNTGPPGKSLDPSHLILTPTSIAATILQLRKLRLRHLETLRHLEQRSPTFLAPGPGFVEDNFSHGRGWGRGTWLRR